MLTTTEYKRMERTSWFWTHDINGIEDDNNGYIDDLSGCNSGPRSTPCRITLRQIKQCAWNSLCGISAGVTNNA